MTQQDDRMDRFAESLRRWASKPPRLGAEAASHRVRSAIEAPQARPRRHAVLAVAVTVLLAAALALLLRTHTPAQTTVRPTVASGVVVMWLDKSTPLYMNLEPLRLEKGVTP